MWRMEHLSSYIVVICRRLVCKYDLRKDDLFVLGWARVRRVRRGSFRAARCLETIDLCISDVVIVWRFVGMSVV